MTVSLLQEQQLGCGAVVKGFVSLYQQSLLLLHLNRQSTWLLISVSTSSNISCYAANHSHPKHVGTVTDSKLGFVSNVWNVKCVKPQCLYFLRKINSNNFNYLIFEDPWWLLHSVCSDSQACQRVQYNSATSLYSEHVLKKARSSLVYGSSWTKRTESAFANLLSYFVWIVETFQAL